MAFTKIFQLCNKILGHVKGADWSKNAVLRQYSSFLGRRRRQWPTMETVSVLIYWLILDQRRINPCRTTAGYIRFQADFKPSNMSLKMDNMVCGRCPISQIIQFKRCLFSKNINIFHHLKLEIALAIPASNDDKYNTTNTIQCNQFSRTNVNTGSANGGQNWTGFGYSRIHINRGEWFSPISQSIPNQFSWNFTHTIFHSCCDYPECFAKFW